MAGKSYSAEGIILRKTRLRESDMILRMLDSEGRLLEAISKGARKPQSSSSSRLELFNRVELLCAKGMSLDVITESRLVSSHSRLHVDPAYNAAAACVAEFAGKTAQPELVNPRMFELLSATLDAIDSAKVPQLPMIAAANIFKGSAFLGMRPSFSICVSCGEGIPSSTDAEGSRISYLDGGAVCADCATTIETLPIPTRLLEWAEALLRMRFSEMLELEEEQMLSSDLLHLADQWALTHAGVRLKSVPQLFTYCSLLPE